MVDIEFKFPLESDAHKMRTTFVKFFQVSESFDNSIVTVSHVKKNIVNPDKPIWSFTFSISCGDDDKSIEKYIDVSGGQLNLLNGTRQVWAFA